MPDPKNDPASSQTPATQTPTNVDPPLSFRAPLFGGTLTGSGSQPSPGLYQGNADYLFRSGDQLGAQLRFRTDPGFAIDQYGLNGRFGLGGGDTLRFDASGLPQTDTYRIGSQWQFANGNLFNADWNRTPTGQNYGADGAFKLGKDGNGTAAFRVDEAAGTSQANTQLKFDADTHLNADWLRNRDGQQIYGADSGFKLGKDGTGAAAFRVDETAGTSQANTQLKFDADTHLNADWLRNRDGQQIYGADSGFKLGKDGNGTAAFRVDEAAGTSQANTQLKFDADTHFNADWLRNRDGQQIYGADTGFKLGKDGNGTAAFRVDETAGTSQANTQLKFDANTHLNADWLRNRDGQQIYGADAGFKLGKDGNGTAAFRVDETAGTSQANTQLKFGANTHLNADWLRNRDGQQIYGADSGFKLGKDGNGTAAFRVDEPAGTSMFNTKLKFNDDFHLNADYSNTKAGQVYGADTGFKLGKDGNGTAAFRVDEPAGTSMFNTKLKWNDGFGLGADYTNTKAGAIYGAETTFRLGQNGTGTGGFRVDEPAQTTSANTKLRFDNGDTLNFDLSKSPAGKVYGADAAFGVWRDGKGLASFRIDEPNGASNYKLGASFLNGNELNATLTKDRLGNTFGVGGKVGFSDGAGSVGFDGKFGPVTSVGGSINFKNKDLEYSGVVRADNSMGPFRVSEFGAKVSTTGSDRYQFTAEAGYRPETHETYGRVGITIHFGGGSKPSRPITHAPDPIPFPEPSRPIAASRDPQPVVLPENQGLYQQAVSGVQRLNGSGAQLPVEQTAASLVVLAKENGLRNIDYVAMGHPTAGGKQNLFIGDGDPTGATSRQAHIDRAQAEGTPLRDSLQKMDRLPAAQTSGQQMPAPGQEPVAAARR